MTKKKLIPKIDTINELNYLAQKDEKYLKLAQVSAANLGGNGSKDLDECIRWLTINVNETNSEKGVIDEINFCRDCI